WPGRCGCKDADRSDGPQCFRSSRRRHAAGAARAEWRARKRGIRMNAEQHARAASAMSARSRIIGTVLVLIVAAVCIRFGFWQLSRLEEKRTINAAVTERSAQSSVRLSSA